MASATRTVKVKFDGDAKGLGNAAKSGEHQLSKFQRGMSKVGQTAGGFGKQMGAGLKVGMLGLAGLAGGLLAAGPAVFDMAGKLELMGKKAAVVFGGQLGMVENWAKKNAHAMGLTKREAVGLAAGFADLLIPMGFTREAAAKMATDTIGLSGALAEWSGGQVTAAEAADILSAAYLGERDGLQQLGISISQAEVDAALLAKGQDKLTGKTRQQAEALATQKLIMDKSTDAQKAFATGGGGLARQTAINKARLKEMGQTLLVTAIPALLKLGEAIGTKLMPKLEQFVTWLAGPGKYVIAEWAAGTAGSVLDMGISFLGSLAAMLRGLNTWANGFGATLVKTGKAVAVFNPAVGNAMVEAGSAMQGFGDKAADNLEGFREDLAKARGGVTATEAKIRTARLTAKARADKTDLDAKLASVKRQLADPRLSATKRARLTAEKAQLEASVRAAQARINSLTGKTVLVSIVQRYTTSGVNLTSPSSVGRRASGGPMQDRRRYLLGENGPEVVEFRSDGTGWVHPSGTTPGSSSGAGPMVAEIHIEIGGEVVRVVRTELKADKAATRRTVRAKAAA